jgi:hypothetical protein
VFDEINSVENFVRDLLSGPEMGWFQIDGKDLPRSHDEVFLEEHLRNALIRLNPAIAEDASRADEVLYKLRAILLSVRSEGLVRANERFAAWLVGEHSMPFGPDGEHVTVRLIDIEDFSQNDYLVSTQVVYKPQPDVEVRYDLVLWVNGMPLVVGEAKTATRPAISWVDGAIQVHDRYEVDTPMFFAPNVFSFATEGKTFRYGSVRMPVEKWGPWRATDNGDDDLSGLNAVRWGGVGPAHARDGARRAGAFRRLRHRQETPEDQDHPPLPAVSRRQPDRSACAGWLSAQGVDLALSGVRQIAADGLRRAEAAPASHAQEPDRADRRGPGRSRHADHRHVQCGGRAQYRNRQHAQGTANHAGP